MAKAPDIAKKTGDSTTVDVKRTNTVIVCPTQRTGLTQHNPYIMDVDRRRNCYSCGGFGHLV